jgi:hypothetical protein
MFWPIYGIFGNFTNVGKKWLKRKRKTYTLPFFSQSRTQSNACARARMALAISNAILARAQALLWVRDCFSLQNLVLTLYFSAISSQR